MLKYDWFIEKELPEPLSQKEMYSCFEKMLSGDLKARNYIIEHNIPLVLNVVASKYLNTDYDKKELVCVGILGLIKSIDTFDITKGYKFSTYSVKCIENEIGMFIRKNKKYQNNYCFDEPIYTDILGNEMKLEDIMPDVTIDFVYDYENKDCYRIIREIVNQLPERDRYIIMGYFGFIDNKPMFQQEIADSVGLSHGQISKILKKTLEKISIQLQEQGIIEIPKKRIKK